jgi:hypothetical protein
MRERKLATLGDARAEVLAYSGVGRVQRAAGPLAQEACPRKKGVVGLSRRIVLLAVAATLMLAVVAGVALARSFQCQNPDCFGTNNNDQIRERQGSGKQDDIHAEGGNDQVKARLFGNDTDVLRGNNGSDFLNAADGDTRDVLLCGSGNRDFVVIDVSRRSFDIFSRGCERGRIVFSRGQTRPLDTSLAVSEGEAEAAAAAALK